VYVSVLCQRSHCWPVFTSQWCLPSVNCTCMCVCVSSVSEEPLLASVHKPVMPTISELLDSTFSILDEESHHHRFTQHWLCVLTVLAVAIWQSSNSTTFELQTVSPDSIFDECFNHFVVECEFVGKSLFYNWFNMHRQPESADKPVFVKFNLSHIQ